MLNSFTNRLKRISRFNPSLARRLAKQANIQKEALSWSTRNDFQQTLQTISRIEKNIQATINPTAKIDINVSIDADLSLPGPLDKRDKDKIIFLLSRYARLDSWSWSTSGNKEYLNFNLK